MQTFQFSSPRLYTFTHLCMCIHCMHAPTNRACLPAHQRSITLDPSNELASVTSTEKFQELLETIFSIYMHLQGFDCSGQFPSLRFCWVKNNNNTIELLTRGAGKILDPFNQKCTFPHHKCFPNSTLFISRIVLCRMESSIPATWKPWDQVFICIQPLNSKQII